MPLALSLNLIFPIARGEAVSIVLGVLVLFLFLFLVLRSLGVVPSELHRRHIPREELLRKALELAFRFDVIGPIVPYYSHFSPPPGPQLFAAP